MGSTGRIRGRDRERQLNRRVRRQAVKAATGEEIGDIRGTAHDLEEDGNGGRCEGGAVDREVRAIEAEVEVQSVVNTTNLGGARSSEIREGHQRRLGERAAAGGGGWSGFDLIGAFVAQDGGVHTTVRCDCTDVRDGLDPVVVHRLVRCKL